MVTVKELGMLPNIKGRHNVKVFLMTKQIIPFEEAVKWLGYSKGYLYKLVHERRIPHYKPNGGRLFFDVDELATWLKRNRVATVDELETQAQTYCMKGGSV